MGDLKARSAGFYKDWTIFCSQALSARLQGADSDQLATILLAAGAILGSSGLASLVSANRNTLDVGAVNGAS